ncbi:MULTISPECIES: energy-coupling factor ABC transporter ATP-binding protein [Enterococcus]|uniref:ABC transporter ATP-binding protein n=1 Tax=Enterococcus raffinosus TaxID=71452 RepID=A0AAP5KDE5_9ENTE|nr:MULTISPECIES: ABC transporter ATP-binding protein [Enterococcus]SAM69342.1 cobalt import ATP-binding protein CbiO [Enterococcus faecium]MDT2524056.1 ABC transporter ATP-binding protein [Enterococcus raffinosus]MDT2530302.1 ABC transporter ATP-binding protein [Enterococcus raffinosus]MDT2534963.1 ABC transporter ATP-binding protein [Enterococcus raffinosus]MDT2546335.1 ABC transporter ATP-binding protein [Enterococcus raffinosus]
MSIIELENVTYRYPLDAEATIKNIDLSIEEGKVYGLIGSNQSGKTTLCNIMRGFIPAMFLGELKGTVTYKGKSIQEYNIGALAAEIGYSSQNPFTQISGVKDTVEEELAYGMENIGLSVEVMGKKVQELLALFKLEELKEKNPFELSGGQKQRVALASIVALDPDVILLDEPTSQLDPQSTEEVFEIIAKLKKQGKTIVVIEHKVDLLAEYCDEIILLEEGQVIKHGTAHQVLSDPDILIHGGSLPQVALFYLKQLKQTDAVPITMAEAISKLKGGAVS